MTNPTWAGRSATPPTPEGASQRGGWIPVVGVVAALGLVGAGGYLLGNSGDPTETAAASATTAEVATEDESGSDQPTDAGDADSSDNAAGSDSTTETNPPQDSAPEDRAAQDVPAEDSAPEDSAGEDSAGEETTTDGSATDESQDSIEDEPSEGDPTDERVDDGSIEDGETANQVTLDEGQVRGALLRDGVLYLGGAVPSEEIAEQIIERAEAVVGEGNVVSEYVIDPDADMSQGAPLYIDDVVLFAYGSNRYDHQFEPLLDLGLALLSQNPSVTVTIITHTDASGSASFNDHLSYQRGESVAQYWVDRGIPVEQIRIDARGEREPIANDHTDEGAQLNRRAEFFIEGLLP